MIDDHADSLAPEEIALKVGTVGVAKARLAFIPLVVLSILAGAFIGFGAAFYTLVMTDSGLGLGPARLLGGVAFSTGLVLVIIGGAELFTGNNLIVMAWADRKITHTQLLRNWVVSYMGNFAGAIGLAILIGLSGVFALHDGAVAKTALAIARSKLELPMFEAFIRGVLCNMLVCLAIWLCFAARTVVGKVVAIIFPVSAFVALGFEHSVANMYLIPIAWFADPDSVTVAGFMANLIPVTAGNIVGGSGFVAMAYWATYLRKD